MDTFKKTPEEYAQYFAQQLDLPDAVLPQLTETLRSGMDYLAEVRDRQPLAARLGLVSLEEALTHPDERRAVSP